jgi:hypothetical protein
MGYFENVCPDVKCKNVSEHDLFMWGDLFDQ